MTGSDEVVRLTAFVHGQVQGVGFRWWTKTRALELGLAGRAVNKPDGRVEVIAEGARSRCEQLVEMLRRPDAPGSVSFVADQYGPPRGDLVGFIEG